MARKMRKTDLQNKLFISVRTLSNGYKDPDFAKKLVLDWEEFVEDELSNGNIVKLPYLGKIKVYRFKVPPERASISYEDTLNLWASDEEALNNRVMVKYRNIATDGYCSKLVFSGIKVAQYFKAYALKSLKSRLYESMIEDYNKFQSIK